MSGSLRKRTLAVESRRLKDRIDALCAKAIATPEGPELTAVLAELQDALREHTAHLRKMVRDIPKSERRSKN